MEAEWVISQCNKAFYRPAEGKLVDSWGFISRPTHVLVILAIYLLTVFKGPKIMATRKPFELQRPIMVYNLFQIIMNGYMISCYFRLLGGQSLRLWENICCPVSAAQGFRPYASLEFLQVGKVYYINKIIDLADTCFFILRKKKSQVTFLHVYHHISMILCTYVSLMILRDELNMVFIAINSAVHMIMYAYYFLAALGPSVQKYLWWKKYITTIQICQFLIALSMLLLSTFQGCPTERGFVFMWFTNIFVILLMFVKFYIKSYRKNV
ncbi:elongation of very long chain fatty acids protein [Nesidiocoris tenuis]|uniref:Elongation of very long chain fatty acids protein n=1 Tax=Nesidiocoris tenuis TaxID=355587 RepID=A0ABN7AZE5_9HEMI|nr:elongation of very long chain fatty acids protein [Nesidiocoris tenuis]